MDPNGGWHWALRPSSLLSTQNWRWSFLLAAIVSRNASHMKSWKYMFLVILLILPVVGLVGSNNLSTAIIILGIAVILIFVANPQFLPFLWIGGTGVGFIGIFLSLESYRLERLAHLAESGIIRKRISDHAGTLCYRFWWTLRCGIGRKHAEAGLCARGTEPDMIFSIICEELGLTGAVAVLVIFGLLIWRLMVIATWTKDLFGALLAAGVMGHIMIQVILNVAVVTNTIPNTGITLPFVSYGGTSVVFLLLEMGIALSVSRGVRKEH